MILENDLYRLEVDDTTGSLTGLHDKRLDVQVISEPRLAESFRLLLPTPEQQANYLYGTAQRPPSIQRIDAGIVIHWEGPLQAECGPLDVDVRLILELLDDGMQSQLVVRNGSPYQLAEVWQAMLGGVTGIGARQETRVMIPIAGWSADERLFQDFRGQIELGTPTPEYCFSYPGEMPMPWMAMYNPRLGGGLYIGCHDLIARFKVLRLSMAPGIGHLRADPWPRPDEVDDDIPVGATLSWISFPYTPSGHTFEGPPTRFQSFAGSWPVAAALYRAWFSSRFPVVEPPTNSFHQHMAIQDTMFMLPEGTIQMRFSDMGRWARDAADHGVRAVLASGWDRGGHDNLYPYYEPDPRLGTWDELAAGIRACREAGVKVYFFVNLQPVDCTTEWYQRELQRFRAMDPWGTSVPMGWGMGTVGARLGVTRRPMVFADPAFAEFRQLIVRQMRKLAEIGADGIHIDKLSWSSVRLDFNPDLPQSPDQAYWQGILAAVEEILAACRAVNPAFGLSIEGPWDRLLAYTGVTWVWHSTWLADHMCPFKRAFREWLPTLAVTQPYDFNVVNNAVRFGYQLLIGPAHYTGSMADPRMARLSMYIREVLRIREELAGTIFFGEYLGTDEAIVEAPATVRFSTHRDPHSGVRACVLVNLDAAPAPFTASFSGNASAWAVMYRPFAPATPIAGPITDTIAAEGLVILVEDPSRGTGERSR